MFFLHTCATRAQATLESRYYPHPLAFALILFDVISAVIYIHCFSAPSAWPSV
jgi:hypothetical protein